MRYEENFNKAKCVLYYIGECIVYLDLWIAVNIVKQPCVGTLELLDEMEESGIKCLSEASFDAARNESRSSGSGASAAE